MVFEQLWASSQRNELILIDGGFCHFHLRKDGQLTIREIISTKAGAGSTILEMLKTTEGASSIFAKCPERLSSNEWYKKKGFQLEGNSWSKTGKKLNHWRMTLK